MIKKRSVGLCVVLSIITIGIYAIYWFLKLHNEIQIAADEDNRSSAVIAFLLTVVTFGIYGLYWAYKQGENLDNAYINRGLLKGNRSILYLVLCVIGLSIVALALMQDSLNEIA